VSDFDFEPIRGLPEALPAGEKILWQGAPAWRVLAKDALHVRKILLYFGILLLWRLVLARADGDSLSQALVSAVPLLSVATAGLVVLAVLAWLLARTTVYTITNRRLVMRFGIALPMTVNVPFRVVESVASTVDVKGYGGIALKLSGEDRIAYLNLWPHARRWQFARPQPMMRAIPDVANVSEIISNALVADVGGTAQQIDTPMNAPIVVRQPGYGASINAV
jgi:hypothetical protein